MNIPSEYSADEQLAILDEFKRTEGKCYLDHAGATLYSEEQIDSFSNLLKSNLFCNPHTSKVTEDLVDQVRFKILKHFGTDPDHYNVVFTSGTTAALKLVAECFDFGSSGSFIYAQESHTSVLGMRDIVNTENVFVISRYELLHNLTCGGGSSSKTVSNSLVAFPAQCNFSGFKYPLELVGRIQKCGLSEKKVFCLRGGSTASIASDELYVCLDAASFSATNFLDLESYNPDFVCTSFYKLFGHPTGLGALLVSKRGQAVLKKRYFGGGTVKIAMSSVDFHEKRDCFYERFEDGTIPFLSIISLLAGFDTISRLIPPSRDKSSMQRVSNHVFFLGKYCYDSLKVLQYENKKPLIKLYTYTDFSSQSNQGGIISFNVLHDNGSFVGFSEIACLVSLYNITIRTGCFCNPGACQTLLGLSNEEVMGHYQAGHICGDYNDLVNGVPTGAVRVSFGYMSRVEDVDHFIQMLMTCYLSGKCRLTLLENTKILQNGHSTWNRNKESGIKLKEICIYPVKSCGTFKIKHPWELTSSGLKFDRTWMIINSAGVAVTQKTDTRLCLIRPEIDLKSKKMILNFPGINTINISLEPQLVKKIPSALCQSKVCGDMVEGIDCGDDVAVWLENCLGIQGLRLIRQFDEMERKTRDGKTKQINLSNQAQFLLINKTSVKWLATKVDQWDSEEIADLEGVTDRFRANFVIETANPLEEMNFKKITIGASDFEVQGPCTRCQMICIDQRTGLKTAEPLKTIAKEFKGKIRFGTYLAQSSFTSGKPNFISTKDTICVQK